ncbi:type I-F CRISPR-associated protein Csy1 [Nitrosovibrio sp. Nv4]|uniref:type I-F CRISPR-associated protein Csy1 n=1 Tax=Nitrosovibrio sp. Nv4 TaxID=1945880 RepID=UPI000BD3A546|nr:type I-F CRISPR-associated protein Csy1 [Nitrosovibrio sp. Nv4]SOD41653.1 CRISPR-associated protein, Csy1 family [Nitrosovibrio sp. Nv4]
MQQTSDSLSIPARSHRIRAEILEFLQKRLQPKLDGLQKKRAKLKEHQIEEIRKVELERDKEILRHQPEEWIADAVRRVAQLQQATHSLKFTHPKAEGSALILQANPIANDNYVGTHTIRVNLEFDVVGNAAALDVYTFLRLSVDGQSLLEHAISLDPALAAAFCSDEERAKNWMAAFATLVQPKGELSSHKLAKQIYWPVGQKGYHLLAPLFPTSLLHDVWKMIEDDRFSETSKAARDACRAKVAYPHGYREYPDLAVQNFGGTKPQNISLLNSKRRGKNYLLPSLPPTWRSSTLRPPLRVNSVFDRIFGNRPRVRELTRIFREFLVSVVGIDSNIRIRNKRAELIGYIRDELFQFAAEIHELKAGWSLDPDSRLNPEEQCWLDPGRAREDKAFADLCRKGDWQNAICQRFANWLNARLNTAQTPMGQTEAAHWADILDEELQMIRMELDHG